MDKPVGESSQAVVGNSAIPDWMMKRRARLQAQAANSAASPSRGEATRATAQVAAKLPAGDDVSFPVATSGWTGPPADDDPVAEPFSAMEETATATAVVAATSQDTPFSIIAEPVVRPAKIRKSPPKKIDLRPAIDVVQAPTLRWHEALRQRYLSKEALKSYGVSLGTHLVIALLLSMVVLHHKVNGSGIGAFLGDGDGQNGGDGLDDSKIFGIDTSGGKTSGESLDTMLASSEITSALGPVPLETPVGIGALKLGAGSGNGQGTGQGDGDGEGGSGQVGDGLGAGGFAMPGGGKAVRKGSFIAWTVPNDPAPGEDYKIVIQVQYKNPKQRVSIGDITGSVIGTDDYRLAISRHTAEYIPSANQVVVNIPGAAALVRDTIRVSSALLKESQRLEIVF